MGHSKSATSPLWDKVFPMSVCKVCGPNWNEHWVFIPPLSVLQHWKVWQYRLWSFTFGDIQNPRDFCLKVKCSKGFLDMFWNGMMASLQNLGQFLQDKYDWYKKYPKCLSLNVLKLHNRYCHIERPGYLTPSEPLDHTKSWQCDVCKKTEPAQYVNAVIRSIGEELVSLKNFVDPAMFCFGLLSNWYKKCILLPSSIQ